MEEPTTFLRSRNVFLYGLNMRHTDMKSRKTIHYRKNEQGVALITTLLFLTVMGLLSTTLVFTVQNEMQTSASYKYSQQAFYTADAGVQKAVYWYRNNYHNTYQTNIAISGADNFDTTEYPVEMNKYPEQQGKS